MLEPLETLAKAMGHVPDNQLKNLGKSLVYFNAPADVLLRARKEFKAFNNCGSAATSCSKVVARAEALVKAVAGTKDYDDKFLAMSREIDNLRKYIMA
jgi:hypothetical protein